jgi:hypothetical protein
MMVLWYMYIGELSDDQLETPPIRYLRPSLSQLSEVRSVVRVADPPQSPFTNRKENMTRN